MKAVIFLLLFCLQQGVAAAAARDPKDIAAIPDSVAKENLVTFVQPDYPPLAQATSVMGKVRAEIVIDETGNVESVKLISGHPMLSPSAIAAIKRWKYKPFQIAGKLVVIRTEVEVSMPEHISDDNIARERKFQDSYWPNGRAAREALEKNDLQTAETKLLAARAAAEERGDQKWLELAEVVSLLAGVKQRENDYPRAELLFKESLAMHLKHQRPDEAEIASVQYNLGFLYVRMQRLPEAEPLFLASAKTWESRISKAPMTEAKASYGRHLAMSYFAAAQIAAADHRSPDSQSRCQKAVGYADEWSDEVDKKLIKSRCSSLLSAQ
jgi:TonB family protein